ncbi:MAG: hypothetical protein HZB67_01305 [Candidatus Aenigmarchaeota archaeon]|nr:hypothetical protein [Candidatus Aenigmarchaeota archaeon]
MPSLTDISKTQDNAARDIASYLGSYPVYADAVSIDPRLKGTPVKGVTEIDGKDFARIYYNPEILESDYMKECVVYHEVAHLFQKEHGVMKELYPLMLEIGGNHYYLGLDLLEGTAEFLAEKATGKKLAGVYPAEYMLAERIDKVYPTIKQLYKDVEEYGWTVLDRPEIRKILAEVYSTPSYRVLQ